MIAEVGISLFFIPSSRVLHSVLTLRREIRLKEFKANLTAFSKVQAGLQTLIKIEKKDTCRVHHFIQREVGQGCAASFPDPRCRPPRVIEFATPTRKPRLGVKCSLSGCWCKATE